MGTTQMSAEPAAYEARVYGELPRHVRQAFPALTTCTKRAETSLFRRLDTPAELDALLQCLWSMGLVLTEVHRVPSATAPVGAGQAVRTGGYEVRVEGVLGSSVLRYLSWSHCVIPAETVLRVVATPDDLHRLLASCLESGLVIDRVTKAAPQPAEVA